MVVMDGTVVLVWCSGGCLLSLWLSLSLFIVVSVGMADVVLVVVSRLVQMGIAVRVYVRLVLVGIVLSVSRVVVEIRGRGVSGVSGPC